MTVPKLYSLKFTLYHIFIVIFIRVNIKRVQYHHAMLSFLNTIVISKTLEHLACVDRHSRVDCHTCIYYMRVQYNGQLWYSVKMALRNTFHAYK